MSPSAASKSLELRGHRVRRIADEDPCAVCELDRQGVLDQGTVPTGREAEDRRDGWHHVHRDSIDRPATDRAVLRRPIACVTGFRFQDVERRPGRDGRHEVHVHCRPGRRGGRIGHEELDRRTADEDDVVDPDLLQATRDRGDVLKHPGTRRTLTTGVG
jgi:hypothetical protein